MSNYKYKIDLKAKRVFLYKENEIFHIGLWDFEFIQNHYRYLQLYIKKGSEILTVLDIARDELLERGLIDG